MSDFNQMKDNNEQILEAVKEFILDCGGIVKKSQLNELEIDYRKILHFVEKGEIIRLKSGYYTIKENAFSKEELLVKLFPDGVLTLESALYAYGYVKQKPTEWRIAIDKNTSKSRFKYDEPKVLPMYTEEEMLELGVTTIDFGGDRMAIYEKERLICDCLKYEEKMDRTIFQEGLRSYIEDENKDLSKLIEYATIRKVTKKVQNMIGVWLTEKEKKDATLEECLVTILHYLELIPSMEAYERAYELLSTTSFDGRRVSQAVAKAWSSNGLEISGKRGDILKECPASNYLEKRWKQHCKNRKAEVANDSLNLVTWQEVCGKVNSFLLPIWNSLCKDEIFFGDWMPDLGRYLQ